MPMAMGVFEHKTGHCSRLASAAAAYSRRMQIQLAYGGDPPIECPDDRTTVITPKTAPGFPTNAPNFWLR